MDECDSNKKYNNGYHDDIRKTVSVLSRTKLVSRLLSIFEQVMLPTSTITMLNAAWF